jgi:hypothetical protein
MIKSLRSSKYGFVVMLSSLFLLTSFNVSHAALVFTDRTLFNAAVSNSETITFDNLIGTPLYPQNYPGGSGYFNQSTSGIDVNGINFVGSGWYGTETYILDASVASGYYSLNGTSALLGGRTFTTVTMQNGQNYFGTDIGFDNYNTGTITATIFLKDNTSLVSVININQRSQFFGVAGGEIDHITFDSGGQGLSPYTLLDNVTYSATPTPIPAAVYLLGSGLMGLVGLRRKKRQ